MYRGVAHILFLCFIIPLLIFSRFDWQILSSVMWLVLILLQVIWLTFRTTPYSETFLTEISPYLNDLKIGSTTSKDQDWNSCLWHLLQPKVSFMQDESVLDSYFAVA